MGIRNQNGFTIEHYKELESAVPGGVQSIYKVSPPVVYYDKDDKTQTTEYVFVSAVDTFTGSETYIFPCDEAGNWFSSREMPGSFQGAKDHLAALYNLGHSTMYW